MNDTQPMIGPPRLSGLAHLIDVTAQHDPSHIYCAFSGGNDSVAALEIARQLPGFTAAVFIDTGINLPGVERRAREICEARNVDMITYRALGNTRADGTPDPQDYEQIVLQHGFPGPAKPHKMFDRLKGRAFARIVRDARQQPGARRVLLISGTRMAESQRRARTVHPWQRSGNTVWAAPMWNWSTARRDAFIERSGLPRNPFSAQVGVSGDCLCGAYSKPGELARIEAHYPCVGRRLRDLQRRVQEVGFPWGWEDSPPDTWGRDPMPALFGEDSVAYNFTCATCERRPER